MSQGKQAEAAAILVSLKDVFPEDPEVAEALARIPADIQYSVRTNAWLGANKIPRARVERSVLARILWYFPDRLLDITDVVSVYVDAGPQIGLGVWATQAVKAEFNAGFVYGIGFGPKKQFLRSEMDASAGFGPFGLAVNMDTSAMPDPAKSGGTQATVDATLRSGNMWQFMGITSGLNRPGDPLYQGRKDYYAIGARAGGPLLGVEVNFHPIEVVDLLAGFFGFDPLNDDLSTTRALEYGKEEGTRLSGLQALLGFYKEDQLDQFRKTYKLLSTEAEGKKFQAEMEKAQKSVEYPPPLAK